MYPGRLPCGERLGCRIDNFKIGQASSSDVSVITRIIRKSFLDVAQRFKLTQRNCPRHPSNCREQWIRDALRKGIRYYVLAAEGMPAGCAALEQAGPGVCYLERFAVLPDYRRRGYGSALLAHAKAEAKTIGAQRIEIGIIAAHAELKAWYLHRGFEEVRKAFFEHLPFEVLFMSMDV